MPPSSLPAPPIQTFLPYMHNVARYQRALHDLALSWRLIEASTRISVGQEGACILPTIEGARHHFDELEKKLIGSLVSEKLGGVLRELSAKALYIVDLVVRNLYERTADVAFLATDREISRYMAQSDASNTDDQRIRDRLHAYQRKYTVYDSIALRTRRTPGNVRRTPLPDCHARSHRVSGLPRPTRLARPGDDAAGHGVLILP